MFELAPMPRERSAPGQLTAPPAARQGAGMSVRSRRLSFSALPSSGPPRRCCDRARSCLVRRRRGRRAWPATGARSLACSTAALPSHGTPSSERVPLSEEDRWKPARRPRFWRRLLKPVSWLSSLKREEQSARLVLRCPSACCSFCSLASRCFSHCTLYDLSAAQIMAW